MVNATKAKLRYADDTSLLWIQFKDVQILLDHVYSIKPSIQFKMEMENDNQLALITRTKYGLKTSVYRKRTFIGRYLNFNFQHLSSVKRRIAQCQNHLEKTIISDSCTHHEQTI